MARQPLVAENDLFLIATYLADPGANTEIHAELPVDHRAEFEEEYNTATNNYPLPEYSDRYPYYVLPPETDKRGRELRIYFTRVPPEPPLIMDLPTDYGAWFARGHCHRINHSNLVMQLFDCGFVLGTNHDKAERIAEFMRQRFPV